MSHPSILHIPSLPQQPRELNPQPNPQTGLLTLAGYGSLLTNPSQIRGNYTPKHQANFTNLAARSLGAWFLLSSLVRIGAWWTWGDLAAGFRGWYDGALLTLIVPLWHYGLERNVWGTVGNTQMVVSFGIDGLGAIYMLWVRGAVLAGAR